MNRKELDRRLKQFEKNIAREQEKQLSKELERELSRIGGK